MSKGYLAFVLHAHLPYVHHPEYESFLEERWFFEALSETYIPLVRFCRELVAEQVPFKLTVSISPSLLAMLENPNLQERYIKHLDRLVELGEKEQERNRHDGHTQYLAGYYRDFFSQARALFADQYQGRLSLAFKELHQAGVLELITTAATHGLLPLLAPRPKAVEAQVITGLDYFEQVFGQRAPGMWLPECGYFAGLEDLLAAHGVRYFLSESHAVDHASTQPLYGVHTPLYTPSGVAVFGRDQGSTREVWSAREGFPGDPEYREFYRDIGHDLELSYIRPYIQGDIRCDTGFKYCRITGPTAWKQPYRPHEAGERAAFHAEQFLRHRLAHIEFLGADMHTKPVIVAPFDAELFGHWWFEGPRWLEFVIRKAAFDQDSLELTTPATYLDRHPVHQSAIPASSTWGHQGYFAGWLNSKTDWIYPQLDAAAQRMQTLAQSHGTGRIRAVVRRALQQAMRELLLAQGSDWPFIINGETSAEYATRRVKDHIARFHYLAGAVEQNTIDEEYLSALEQMDDPFPQINYKIFQ